MKKAIIICTALLVTLSLSSCLNDLEDFMGAFSSSPALAELSEAPSPATGTVNREIKDPTKPLEVKFRVNIAVAKPLSKPTKVTLAIDPALVTAYNAERGLTGSNAAQALPMAALTIPSYEVTIPANKYETDWAISIDATKVPDIVAKFYVIPVKIASADNGVGVSGNFGTKIMRVLSRNKYDGIYTVTGSYHDFINTAAWKGSYPKTLHLVTTGQYTVDRRDADYNDLFYHFLNNGSGSYFGAWTPYFQFDADDNLVAVPNSTNDPLPRGRTSRVADGEAPNKFNADRSMEVAFFFVQKDVTPEDRAIIKEKFTYVGPRP